jgi:hypothetical protein|tara:strand:- start:92 stop:355 length:264 start_codon:yes stop_codon:yes gene_type:complete
MKTQTLFIITDSNSDSNGGKDSSIKQITPSAGLYIVPGIEGVTLSGSLKNHIMNKVIRHPRAARGSQIKKNKTDIHKAIKANFHPSG